MMKTSNLTFSHKFQDGRQMTIKIKRDGGLPIFKCKERFTGAESAEILQEYVWWRQEVFLAMTDFLTDDELLAAMKHGQDLQGAK